MEAGKSTRQAEDEDQMSGLIAACFNPRDGKLETTPKPGHAVSNKDALIGYLSVAQEWGLDPEKLYQHALANDVLHPELAPPYAEVNPNDPAV